MSNFAKIITHYMFFVDTHTHLYLESFNIDRDEAVKRALNNNIKFMLLPNIDLQSIEGMNKLASDYPLNVFPMMALHPTSVKSDFQEVLCFMEKELENNSYCAIGETGIDLYWDTTYEEEQKEAFRCHISWADKYCLPLVIHSRKALSKIIEVIKMKSLNTVKGVFHCYPGDAPTALEIVEMGYYIGIGGVVTYKKSGLVEVIKAVGVENILLETDAPFLPPVPFRGKRNESAYITIIAEAIADILNISIEKVADITSQNAINLFKIKN